MKVAVIGGGAAGLMTTAAMLETDPSIEVVLIDRNDGLGKKVIISGGGRCNVTTGILDVKTVLTKYPRGNKFLNSAIRQFPPQAVYDWFEEHGVPLKTQDDLRVFPQSDHGRDVVRAFERLFAQHKVEIRLRTAVAGISKSGEQFKIDFRPAAAREGTLDAAPESLHVDKVVLTTGGQAYRATGSTGDGYAFAMSLGHSITKLAASLNSFGTKERWVADVSGLSFKEAKISAFGLSFTGPFLFTHRGVSGPAVFALSSLVAFETYNQLQPMQVTIDLFPDDTADAFREKIRTLFFEHAKKGALNVIAMLIPKSLAEVMGAELKIASTKHAGDFSKADQHAVADWLKGIPLTVITRGAGDEFVTAGGVRLNEVNPSTMESVVCPGLYFAGEILDVDGFTGGFNLQASWATGRLAGLSIATAS